MGKRSTRKTERKLAVAWAVSWRKVSSGWKDRKSSVKAPHSKAIRDVDRPANYLKMKKLWRMARRVGALACVAGMVGWAGVRAQDGGSSSESARKMAELLRKIYEEQDWKTDPNKDAERAKYLKKELAAGPEIGSEVKVRAALAESRVRGVDSERAVERPA